MINPETDKERSRRMRRMIVRKVVLLLVLVIVMGGYSAHQAGYAILIGGAISGETTSGGMAHLNCTYFTGTEKVISHIMRPVGDSGRPTHCPLATKLPKRGPLSDDMSIPLPRQPLPSQDAVPQTPSSNSAPNPVPAPTQN